MKRCKGLLVLCCAVLAGTVFAGCDKLFGGLGGSNSSNSESVVPNDEITVKFDPCMEDYEGLKTNTPLAQKLEKGDSVKEPTVRALENPNNYTCEGWYTSKDYTTKWNFKTDTVQESMTLYAKWVQSCSVHYYLTDGETSELKRTVTVAKNGLAQKIDALAQGYELLGYYKDEALTQEFDFTSPIVEETNVYIKRSPYIYLDAKFIAENFTGVASNAGENGATFGGIEYVEEEDYVEVDFGYCPDVVDSHIIMQNIPLVINKSQKIEVTMKMPEGNDPLGALVLYVTSLYEDKSIAVFQGANGEMAAHVNLKQINDEGWVTATIDLGEKLYGGASIWANSTYLGLLRVQLQYSQPSLDKNDTHSVYIKSIKGVADDTYVGAEDTFEDGTLENDAEEILDESVSTVENGFSFPADRAEVNGEVVNGAAYNKEEGLLVYMPYRTPYNEVNLKPEEGKAINLDENKVMKLRIKNLGYIPYLEIKFENTDGFSSSSIEVKLPSQMTEFETLNIDLNDVVGLSGTLKNVKIAANSKGIDNAYIIESIEFVEYIIDPVTGFAFNEIENTDSITNEYSSEYKMFGFEVKESGASFSKEYTQYAIHGYDSLTLGYVNPEGDITKVNVTLTVDECDYTYAYDVAACDSIMTIEKSLEGVGNVSKMTVSFEGTGTIYLDALTLGSKLGIDLTDKEIVERYLSVESWMKGMYDATEGAARIDLAQAPAMLYLADAGFKNIEIGDNNKLYLIYQNRGEGNQPLTILLYGTETVNGGINYGNYQVYYFDSVKYMSAGEWAAVEIDLSDFNWEYINLVKIQNDEGSSEELYVRAVTLDKVETTVVPEPENPVINLDLSVKENAQMYLDNAWVKGEYDETESALKVDLAQAAAMFYLAPTGATNNLKVSAEKKLYVTYQIRGELTNQPIIISVFGGDSATDAAWDTKKFATDFWKDVQRSMTAGQWAVLEMDLSEFAWEYISVVKLQAGDAATAGEMYIKEITFEKPEIETPDPEPETPANALDLSVKENAQMYLDNAWVKGEYDETESALKADLAQAAAMFYLAPTGATNNLKVSAEKKLYVTYQIRGELTNQPIIISVFGGDSATDAAWDTKKFATDFWKDVQRSMVSGQWATLEIDLTDFAYDYISVVKVQAGDPATAGEIWIKDIALA